jgi:hypothetical protein
MRAEWRALKINSGPPRNVAPGECFRGRQASKPEWFVVVVEERSERETAWRGTAQC